MTSDKIKVYQKPTCSKCRTTIGILREKGADFESINHYVRGNKAVLGRPPENVDELL